MAALKLQPLLAGICDELPESVQLIAPTNIYLDSRQLLAGGLFVAVRGLQSDGRRFIHSACSAGACAVLREADAASEHGDVEWLDGVAVISCWELNSYLGLLAQRFYQVEQSSLNIIGVTGTNGKSTVTHLMASLAELCGSPSAVMGTLGCGRLGELTFSENTTADVFTIHRQLAEFASQGIQLVAMEVSSHGLTQQRVAGVPFKAAVFTNLTRDHLDYHGSMGAYGEAKSQLFDWPSLKIRVVNIDDAFGGELSRKYPLSIRCSRLDMKADWTIAPLQMTQSGCLAKLSHADGSEEFHSPLLGFFNLDNLLAAIATLSAVGWQHDALLKAAPQVQAVPGRMECFGTGPVAVVDYAHTPDALTQALQGMRAHCSGRIICVFGCGGDRDQGKRPMMAKAAERDADQVIVTDDNPRNEAAKAIVADILQGFEVPSQVLVIHERREAIAKALEMATAEDMVLVAGKGHEDYQIIGSTKRDYDERAVVRELTGGARC